MKLQDVKFEGVTLKHVVDSIFCPNQIYGPDGSIQQSLFRSRLEQAGCTNLLVTGEKPLHREWLDWST
jgi:hypothetical protein